MSPILAMFGAPGWVELTIVGLIVLLLFGSRLPSVMRSLGLGITEFKKGIKGEVDEEGNPVIEAKDDQTSESSESAERSTTTV